MGHLRRGRARAGSPTTFRKGRAQLISQAFIPLIGRRAAEGPIGKGYRHPRDLQTLRSVPRPRWYRRVPDRWRVRRAPADRRPGRDPARWPRSSWCSPSRRSSPRFPGSFAYKHPVAVQHQHGAGRAAGPVRVQSSPDGDHPRPHPDPDRRLI
ncbi:hypothetical protein HBB16_02045 [Pseudonocardia sp. MCCB 268]|nr:hypothetical protein [Pseudonocardia cytotoxica]